MKNKILQVEKFNKKIAQQPPSSHNSADKDLRKPPVRDPIDFTLGASRGFRESGSVGARYDLNQTAVA